MFSLEDVINERGSAFKQNTLTPLSGVLPPLIDRMIPCSFDKTSLLIISKYHANQE